jgi:phage-related protein
MANFDNDVGLSPDYGLEIEHSPKINTITFGDGFEQRLTEGLNQNARRLSLTFSNITESQSDTLINFLNDRATNAESFDYTLPSEASARKFVCTNFPRTIPYLNRVRLTCVFREVFEP